jgi:Fic family protein
MKYISLKEMAVKLNMNERTLRRYCDEGRVDGAKKEGRNWLIPEDTFIIPQTSYTSEPIRLLDVLRAEKETKVKNGIYHLLQIDLTYNSNHIEGSGLTERQTRNIYETNILGVDPIHDVRVDDIVETTHHFRCIDLVIQLANNSLNENIIKNLHYILKSGTKDSMLSWFNVGLYKKRPNQVGGTNTALPEEVPIKMKSLIDEYNSKEEILFEDIIAFHAKFEKIHPFQDGNGRIGRLIILKECLKHNYIPFYIDENSKQEYYKGLANWENDSSILISIAKKRQLKFVELLKEVGIVQKDLILKNEI